jgi:hypothetical protein
VTPIIDFKEPKLSFASKKGRGAAVTCNKTLKYCTIDDAEINYELMIIYADGQAEWTPGLPFLENSADQW